AVALGLVAEGPDHLAVAVDAAFADVEVAAGHLERGPRRHAGRGRHAPPHEEHRGELDDGADEDGERGEDGEDERPALEEAVAPVRPDEALHVDLGLRISDCGRGAVNSAIRIPQPATPGWPRRGRRGPSA